MESRPRLLDLFCGAGGSAMGYRRAGFTVTGVDLDPQPDYPFASLIQADALEVLRSPWFLAQFDAIHASPPCQAYTAIQKGTNAAVGRAHPMLTEPVRELLLQSGLPYVLENPAARPDVVLCGEMFGLGVLRHRKFELGGWTMEQPAHIKHRGRVRGWRHGEFFDGPYISAYGNGGGKGSVPEMQAAMCLPWISTRHGLVEALPPDYTTAIGQELSKHLGRLRCTTSARS